VASPAWHLRSEATPVDGGNYMPTLELVYGDGTVYGNGYMESWIFTSRKTISGINQARETITAVTGTQIVSNIAIRLRHDSGNDPLTVTLRNASGVIESGTIPAASFVNAGNAGDNWVTYTFVSPRTLGNGNSYQLVLSTAASSAYSIFPLRKGATHNFGAPSYFADGYAQYSQDASNWSNWPDEGGNPSAEGDLQFYMTVARAAQLAPPSDLAAVVH
jgi:hypothetical protein